MVCGVAFSGEGELVGACYEMGECVSGEYLLVEVELRL